MCFFSVWLIFKKFGGMRSGPKTNGIDFSGNLDHDTGYLSIPVNYSQFLMFICACVWCV